MKRFEAYELVNYWEGVFHESASKAATEIFMDGLKRGDLDGEDIQNLEDIKSALADQILHEFEYIVAEVFPEYVFDILANREPFIVKTDEGELRVDGKNYNEVIPDVVVREFEKQYKFGLWSIAERDAEHIVEINRELFKQLLRMHKQRRRIAELKGNATQAAVNFLKSFEAGEIIVSDIEDFRTLLQEHLANYFKEAFPKAKGKLINLINNIAEEIAKSFTEAHEEVIQSIISLRKQAIEGIHRISL